MELPEHAGGLSPVGEATVARTPESVSISEHECDQTLRGGVSAASGDGVFPHMPGHGC